MTGHAEVVLVAFRAAPPVEPDGTGQAAASASEKVLTTSFEDMLRLFWEGHDPTQGMRQGNDVGTQYRSLILWSTERQREEAEASLTSYQQRLSTNGYGEITTELAPARGPTGTFYYAEEYHQQYLAKNPGGYCGLGGTGVSCPVGLTVPTSPTGTG
jgi:peptide-methionine (S)-S-oxide reductase